MTENLEQISRSELLDRICAERMAFEATLARLSPDQFLQAGVQGAWSVKDILAHVSAWERRMVGWMDEALAGKVPALPQTDEEVDALNALSYAEDRDKPLDRVMAESLRSSDEAYQVAQAAAPEDLEQADRFPWRQGVGLWRMVAANTWWHYREHGETIRAWLENQP